MIKIPGYHVIGLLAKGGMGRVFLARHLNRKRKVAIKVYTPNDENREQVTRAYREESRIMANLHHINVISTYDKGELENGDLYIVMEYVEGGSLRERLANAYTVGELMALGTLVELAHALNFIHHRGYIHCDVKPGNILFRRDNSLVVTDFGIAKEQDDPFCHTKQKTIMVSPDYASPEQVQGMPFDIRTDIYGAGLVFLEMLTGKNPYRGANLQETLHNHIHMDPPVLNDHLNKFQYLIDKTLAPSPEDRFDDMMELIEYVDRLMITLAEEETPGLGDLPITVHEHLLECRHETTLLRAASA